MEKTTVQVTVKTAEILRKRAAKKTLETGKNVAIWEVMKDQFEEPEGGNKEFIQG